MGSNLFLYSHHNKAAARGCVCRKGFGCWCTPSWQPWWLTPRRRGWPCCLCRCGGSKGVGINPFVSHRSNMCCPRDCVPRHNGGTSGAPLQTLRDDSAFRALSSLRGFKGGTRSTPIMPRDAVSRTANVERNGGHKWVKTVLSMSLRQDLFYNTLCCFVGIIDIPG